MDSVNSSEEESALLVLPYLAKSKILQYLNLNSLKNLRLVSHSTKSWVEENPKLLEKFNCHISSGSQLREVTESCVPWNCFTIGRLSSNELTSFLEVFGNVAKHLEINTEEMNSDYILNTFGNGQDLESLSISSVRRSESITNSTLSSSEGISKIFQNLKSLEYSDHGRAGDNEAGIFRTILPMCPNLNNICVSKLYSDEASSQDIASDIIYNPLLEYLKKRAILPKNELTIDLGGGGDENMADSRFLKTYTLNYQKLLEIVNLCQPIGGKLVNVPIEALPKLKDSKDLTREQLVGLENVIQSIGVNSTKELRNTMIPSTCDMIMDIYGKFHHIYSFFEFHGKIKVIRLRHRTDRIHEFTSPLEVRYRVSNVVRPSLIELTLERNSAVILATGLQISTSFPNLQILELTIWGENDEDFHNLLKGLPQLQDLTLRSCIKCTDAALLGPDLQNPLIRQLPNLQHLNLDETNITDSTFVNALKYMKLRTFTWSPFSVSSDKVTFQHGISSLGTIEGGFRDWIEMFECDVTTDCIREDLIKLIKSNFRSIKGFQV